MKLVIYFGLFAIVAMLTSCGGEPIDKSVQSNVEVLNDGKIKNSSIYHNPITADKPLNPDEAAKMEFEEMAFDFGAVQEGEKVEHVFKFTNTGKAPLTISEAKGSCGCTVPQWPKEPVLPGEKGEINVVFNSEGKEGRQQKDVTITANTIPNQTVIKISGKVIVK